MESLASLVENLLKSCRIEYRQVLTIDSQHVRISFAQNESVLIARENGVVTCRDQSGKIFEFQKRRLNFLNDEVGSFSVTMVTAPTTGRLKEMNLVVNQKANKGDVLCVIESMKMETQVRAPFDLEVKEVMPITNGSVTQGQLLAKIKFIDR